MHILRRIASTTAILSCIFLVFLYVFFWGGGGVEFVFFCFCLLSLLLLFFFVVVTVFCCFWGVLGEEGCGGRGVLLSRFPLSKRFTICDL